MEVKESYFQHDGKETGALRW